MSRKIFLWIAVLALSWVTSAQTSAWQVWLYNPDSGQITHLDHNGYILDQIQLPLPNRFLRYSFDAQVSASGERVVYIASDTLRDQHRLMVYHLKSRRIIVEYALPPRFADGLDLAGEDSYLFNETESALAFGFSQPNGGWQIHIIDLQKGIITLILRSNAPNTADLPAEEGLTPIIRRFQDGAIIFTLAPASGRGNSHAYIWQLASNSIVASQSYNELDTDTFAPSGEIVANSQSSIAQQSNRLIIMTSAGTPTVIYEDNTLGFFMPRFVQNGARILLATYDRDGNRSYMLINRQGLITPWTEGAQHIITALRGTADGWIYLADTVEPGSGYSTLYSVTADTATPHSKALFRSANGEKMRLIGFKDSRIWAQPHPPFVTYSGQTTSPTVTPTAIAHTIPQWSAWIYDDIGRAYRINQNGILEDIQDFAHPFSTSLPDLSPMPNYITASEDGRILAGVYKEAGLPRYLDIIDTETDITRLTYTLEHDGSTAIPSHSIERAPRNQHFNDSGTMMAFGYGLGSAGWQLVALDLIRGVEIGVLRHDSPSINGLLTETSFGVVPIIQKVEDDAVHFTIQPAGPLEPPYPSFVWHITSNTVTPTLIYAGVQTDSFAPTGEVIMAVIDTRLNNSAENFRYGQINALHVYDPLTSTRYPFYNAVDLWLFPPLFIQNGERILVGGSDATGTFVAWAVLERDGKLVGVLPIAHTTWEALGVGDGFIYLATDPTPDAPTVEVRLVNTREQINAGRMIWATSRQGRVHLVWAGYAAQRTNTNTWAQLAAPILAINQAYNAENSRQLVIGGQATIRTTGNNALFLRANPDKNAIVLTRLSSGTRITIIGGPVVTTGETWWQIRTPSGLEGWAIGQADGIVTLVPE